MHILKMRRQQSVQCLFTLVTSICLIECNLNCTKCMVSMIAVQKKLGLPVFILYNLFFCALIFIIVIHNEPRKGSFKNKLFNCVYDLII